MVSGYSMFMGTTIKLGNSSAQEANQNAISDLKWKKQIKVGSVITKEDFVSSLENRYSCWLKLKRVIAFIIKWKANHHRKESMLTGENNKVTMNFVNENFIYQIKARSSKLRDVSSNWFNQNTSTKK